MKPLFIKAHLEGQPFSRVLIDNGAAVNILPTRMLAKLRRTEGDLLPTEMTVTNFAGEVTKARGILPIELTVGKKTTMTAFFVVDTSASYNALLGRDWIHPNLCIPSTLNQVLVFWNGDEVEVVPADDKPFVADVHNADAMLYHEDVGPIKFFGIDKYGRPKRAVAQSNMNAVDWRKIYAELSRPNTMRPMTDFADTILSS